MSWNHILLLAALVLLGLILVKRWAANPSGRQRQPLDIALPQGANATVAPTSTDTSTHMPTPTSTPVTESVSVVLRRQVPVRWDEPPRSWIGGLPMMPESVEWPCASTVDYPERGRTPMHFVAQIACADLPPDLWGGYGPRSGWLLLFINAQECGVREDGETIRVLHIAKLGPERAPPPGIQPVRDEAYTGADYGFVRSQAEVPTTWRRWPVDLVTIPNQVVRRECNPHIVPEKFSSILYDGAPTNDEFVRPPAAAPFCWRGALYVVDSITRVLGNKRHMPTLDARLREQVASPGFIAGAIDRIDAEIAKWLAPPRLQPVPAEPTSEFPAWHAAILGKLQATRQLLADCADEAALVARMEQTHRDYATWRDGAPPRVAALRERILAHELDTPLAADDWDALRAVLEADRQPYWFPRDDGTDGGLLLVPVDQSLLDYARDGLRAAQVQLAADYYVSRDQRHLVPDALVAFMEPYWRGLYWNQPHRMGGIHDALQSNPKEGPTSRVLLFQIATDDAMHWVFGDCGTYFVFIDTDRLAANDFNKLESDFEN